MRATKTNTSDSYILHVYKKRNNEKSKIYSQIIFPFKEAFGDIAVNIDDIFTYTGEDELINKKYFIFIKILGNINNKCAQQGLYFKSKEIRDNFLATENKLKSLQVDVRETIDTIEQQHGKPKQSHAILAFNAKKH